jgi:Ankyrin repeats (3 copies)
VKEFLTSHWLACSGGEVSQYHISLESAHTVLAQACLGVLLSLDDDIVKHHPNEDRSVKDSTIASNHWSASESLAQQSATTVFPLARYTTEHWVTHVQFENMLSCVQKGIERLFDPDKLLAWLKYNIDKCCYLKSLIPRRSGGTGTPLYYASLCGFHDLAECLISKQPQHVNACGSYYKTPLGTALAGNHFHVAQLLCQHGVDVDVRGVSDLTPLHFALAGGHLELVQLLLSHGADANTQDQVNATPLHWTASRGHSDVARILLEHNANANA